MSNIIELLRVLGYYKKVFFNFSIIMNQESVFTPTIEMNAFLGSVYRWMTGALALSGVVAWQAASSEAFLSYITQNSGMFFGLIAAQLGLVFYLSFAINRMSATKAMVAFILYAALTGLTLSTIFAMYTVASIGKVFAITALTFGALSIYGSTTSRDLSGWGSFLFMSLIGLIVASLVNLFMASHFLDWVTSYAGIIIFAGLVAYDTQKLKYIGASGRGAGTNLAIFGALSLYLDFINLFMHLLRVMGDRR